MSRHVVLALTDVVLCVLRCRIAVERPGWGGVPLVPASGGAGGHETAERHEQQRVAHKSTREYH